MAQGISRHRRTVNQTKKERKKSCFMFINSFVLNVDFYLCIYLFFFLDKSSFCVLGIAGWQLCWFATWLAFLQPMQSNWYIRDPKTKVN